MTKHIWTISILLLGLVAVARGQQTASGGLSNVDKTAIIEAVLKLEPRRQSYGGVKVVSSENIEFFEPSRITNYRFRYLPAKDIAVLKKDQLVEYLRFNQIFLRDGVAVVTLFRVTAGRACFAESYSSEKGYTYEARPTAVGWIAKLTQEPDSPISFPPLSFSRKVFPRR